MRIIDLRTGYATDGTRLSAGDRVRVDFRSMGAGIVTATVTEVGEDALVLSGRQIPIESISQIEILGTERGESKATL